MLIKLSGYNRGNSGVVTIRCPACGNNGTFEPLDGIADAHSNSPSVWLCQRRCPNPTCNAHVFCIHHDGQALRTYPPQRIDFDSKSIPDRIVATFTEALSCHAENLHVSAAIMIRRTLEELCEDKQATGNNLKDRIKSLQSTVVLPKELFAALDDVRLLGNDAAHVEAKTYDSVGVAEIEVAIELTKEVLKAVYQLENLVSRLRALKKP